MYKIKNSVCFLESRGLTVYTLTDMKVFHFLAEIHLFMEAILVVSEINVNPVRNQGQKFKGRGEGLSLLITLLQPSLN